MYAQTQGGSTLINRLSRLRIRIAAALVAGAALAAGGVVTALAASHGDTRIVGATGMSGMRGSTSVPMPMPIRVLGHTVWQGMRIEARAMAPATFEIFNGSHLRIVKPTKKDTMHLMVMLSDARTGKRIPYASVWATMRRNGKIVYDERQWPMLSRFMGSHYGNNVTLPGNGTYKLTLLVSPPAAARHMEYANVWLEPHRVTMTLHWNAM